MKNYSETICNKQKRTLTAKAYKFLQNCITIALNKRGLNSRYLPNAKPIVKQLDTLIIHLFIDLELSINEVKAIINNRIEKNTISN